MPNEARIYSMTYLLLSFVCSTFVILSYAAYSPFYVVNVNSEIADLSSNAHSQLEGHHYQPTRQLRGEQQSLKHEDPFKQFQSCRDSGEAYSAAYLIHREHLINQHTAYNLTWVNCEMGSFIMMNKDPDPQSGKNKRNKDGNATLLMSVDVLDFSIIHLSAFERLQRRWIKIYKGQQHDFKPILDSVAILKKRAVFLKELNISHELHDEFKKTVVVMPFLGSDMGAGHSQLTNRLAYLSACFWSFYSIYPNIVAMVKSPKDQLFARLGRGIDNLQLLYMVHCGQCNSSASASNVPYLLFVLIDVAYL